MFIGSRPPLLRNARTRNGPRRGPPLAPVSSFFGSPRKPDESSLQPAHFVRQRGKGKSRGREIARVGELLQAQRQLGGALSAQTACGALEGVRGPLQRVEISRIEGPADLEQALRAVFDEEVGQLAQQAGV